MHPTKQRKEMNSRPPFDNSPFVRRIRKAIAIHAPFDGKLRVSVADEAKWEKSSEGDEVLVRWVCWNLIKDGVELIEPSFEVLSDKITREQLMNDLPLMFPAVDVEVDNLIEV